MFRPAILMVLAAVVALPVLAQDTIKVGVSTPLSADLASYGRSTRDGIVLGIEEVNAGGGVLGRQIELIIEDNQSRPDQAKTVFEKLIKRDKVVAILGDVTSQSSLAAAPVAQQAQVPMLSPTATNELLTKQGDYIFRACFMDSMQGSAMARFAAEDLKAKRVAVLYNVKDAYSTGLRDAFVAAAKERGIEIPVDLSYSSGDVDFRGQLTRIRSARVDAIYCPGYYNEVGLICRQARSFGIRQPLLGSDGWDSDKTAEIGGDSINGCFFTNHYSAEDTRPEVQQFVKAYQGKYGRIPDALAILGYDAAKLLADAIKRAGSTDGAALRAALASTQRFPGATGSITIDEDRNARKPIVILRIEDRKFRFHKAIEL